MSQPPADTRRASFHSRSRSRISSFNSEAGSDLQLIRTISHDVSLAENAAVHEVPDPESKRIGIVDEASSVSAVTWPKSVRYMIYLCAFLTSTSFGTTQVPLLYVFRLMTCDSYYQKHPEEQLPYLGQPTWITTTVLQMSRMLTPELAFVQGVPTDDMERCSNRAIDSATALHISLLGASNTVFGIMNLFLTGSLIKTIGLKRTLMLQVGFPAVRLLVQNIGVEVWGETGIIIIQCSQIASVLGGPSGYMLVLNAFITEVVDYEERTAGLGRVAGSMMVGQALGFLAGGVLAQELGIKIPFRVTFVMFVLSCAFVAVALPHVPPAAAKESSEDSNKQQERGFTAKFFGPLFVFSPKKFILKDGSVQREFGVFLLACGVFLGILATGYLQTLLQLYATDVFKFGTEENGWLIFMYSLLRGIFLTFAFPRIIAAGRALMVRKYKSNSNSKGPGSSEASESDPLLARSEEPEDLKAEQNERSFMFDLIYTRSSLLADGLLTLLCSFVQRAWQMYLVAAVLPFAAGTGSAAKGTVLLMVGAHATSSERTDALAGLSLVENMARLSTTFVFGVVFAAFASIGRTELVFTCNAAVACIGFIVLFFARFPPQGSRRLDRAETSTQED